MTLHRRVMISLFFLISAFHLQAASQMFTEDTVRVIVDTSSPKPKETILLRVGESWVEALTAQSSSVRVRTEEGMQICTITDLTQIEHGFSLRGDCGVGT